MALHTFSCPCLFGLESVLSGEVRRIGGQDVETNDGRVSFKGDAHMMARANIYLRTAERVLVVIGSFRAETFSDLFEGVHALPIENFIGSKDSFPVKGWSISSKLKSISDCQAIVKRALAKRLGTAYGSTWLEETGPLHQVRFSILRDIATLTLDTSGTPLHKRGYRTEANTAPIKETLASGIADLARVKEDTLVIDPMCGSGTLLIEAATKALRIPPGLKRRFSAESWGLIPPSVWQDERKAGFENIRRDGKFQGIGYDFDAEALELTQNNAKRAGVDSKVSVSLAALESFTPPSDPCVILTNPPYGERMLQRDQAEEIIRLMGKVFKPVEGKSYYIISPHENFERVFGREANRRRKLNNGDIRCQLYMYY